LARQGDMPIDGEGVPGDLLVQVDVYVIHVGLETPGFQQRRIHSLDGFGCSN
jgi:hypothetical protein